MKKKSKIRAVENLEEHSITIRNYTVTYCQTPEEVPRLLRLEKPINRQKFAKKCKFYEKKIAKICHIKKLKAIPWDINFFQ